MREKATAVLWSITNHRASGHYAGSHLGAMQHGECEGQRLGATLRT